MKTLVEMKRRLIVAMENMDNTATLQSQKGKQYMSYLALLVSAQMKIEDEEKDARESALK
jgi:hypothetical protein